MIQKLLYSLISKELASRDAHSCVSPWHAYHQNTALSLTALESQFSTSYSVSANVLKIWFNRISDCSEW